MLGGNLFMEAGVTPVTTLLARLDDCPLKLGNSCFRWKANRLVKIAPNTAPPSELPMLLKKVTDPVATPSSERGTAFWTAKVITCKNDPTPSPKVIIQMDSCNWLVFNVKWLKSHTPIVASKVPKIGKIL